MLTGSTTGISTYKGEQRALRADRIGAPALLLSVLAATAPLLVVAGVIPTTFATMGIVGVPLLFVIVGVVLILFSFGYAEMSRHVHNAGALYAYISRGLGGTVGAGASYVALFAYSLMQCGSYGLFGFEISSQIAVHWHHNVAWWIPALGGVAITAVFGALKIDLNAKTLGVLLLIETLMIVVFDIGFLNDPGAQGVSTHAFDPSTLSGAGLGTALCFTIAGFLGFEQAPVYAEETSDPQRVVSKVMFLAVGFATVFFALSAWAITVATGPGGVIKGAQEQGPNLIFALTQDRLGTAFTDVLNVFFITGIFASMLSFHNVVARYAFAMGRDGLLPAAVGRTSKSSGAPAIGSYLQSAVALIVVVIFAVTDHKPVGDPTAPVLRLFTWLGNVGALGVVLLMCTAAVAVISFFVKRGAARVQGWRLVTSALAALALGAIFVYSVKDFSVLLGANPGHGLRWLLPGIIALAAVIGLVYGAVLRSRQPEVHARIGQGNEAFQLEKAAAAEAGA
ncbi:APC family permease [Streptomyces cocklensis]|jgi:amino acid transporter|uniref:Amino acid/polyamine/organocation transporter, APC superfamily n=1 Tax=Actinacidiphila cocklensis TaxID=887465 RepID=A0A9W4GPF6_9ACTN|nr:APC family permease [Actinacidiphila cocklensis]MDD1059246.1 APC family permease [Actinacidiphila cocklensis]WSX73246.1 APC family permease [Streptomyces sp. NBC_00899]WSX80688.1 APC family permease [Streptomyces sp. NBC_00899]CAG6392445.1 Amino acid/polyamine/organocation transporter, APC superfamily [Actinacidiphila cocklensis]